MPTLPPSFLLTTKTPVAKVDWPGDAVRVTSAERLTPIVPVGELDADRRPFEVRLGWSPEGLIIAAIVGGKTKRAREAKGDPAGSDAVIVCLDSRDTKTIRRAGRFCHRFRLLPKFEGKPWARQEPVPRAREDAKFTDVEMPAAAKIDKNGYTVVAAIPAAALTGYDPAESPRMGFHAELQDAELGVIPWSGDRALPSDADPSLWQSVELVG